MRQGRIENRGTYDKLQKDGTDFAALLQKKNELTGNQIESIDKSPGGITVTHIESRPN